ncbi:MAG: DNA polymerase III subunit alpha [Clostridia bacterium]|nr:DNA polymerase III subunit alpha [Clostridia bacterium]
MSFTHLHLHTGYSLLNGACKIYDVLQSASEKGFDSLAITDDSNLCGAIEFYKTALSFNIKPIIGMEIAVRKAINFEKSSTNPEHRLILLCENEVGYKNLMQITSIANTQNEYKSPAIDKENLKKYSKGLIAICDYENGEITKHLFLGNEEFAREALDEHIKIFGKNNFFIEIQNHFLPKDESRNFKIINFAKKYNTSVVASNNIYFTEKTDYVTREILCQIGTKDKDFMVLNSSHVKASNDKSLANDEYYLKSKEQMMNLFDYAPEAIENAKNIADRCNLKLEFGKTKLPYFKLPTKYSSMSHLEYLKFLVSNGLKLKYEKPTNEIIKRLDYELKTIESMGFVDYFLIVSDFVNFAKTNDISVGPGRGSGAGSLVAYLIGITDVDPLEFGLLFERFLNPERSTMPDFDIDVCFRDRHKIIEYIRNKYGQDNVTHIITFGTLAARAVIRDVSKAISIDNDKLNLVLKYIDKKPKATIDSSLEENKKLELLYNTDKEIKTLIDYAKKLEGFPRHRSVHAAGIVITDENIREYVPVVMLDKGLATQYNMIELEELGLLKMDLLALRNLTAIKDTQEKIKIKNPSFDINEIRYDDDKTFKMLSRGEGIGVFQFEKEGLRRKLIKLKPTQFRDIMNMTSLYRPGPMNQIDDFIERKNNPRKIKYAIPQLKEILDETYGIIVFQEQVMQIFRKLAGYSFAQADLVRRAMSKKKHDIMQKERQRFIDGAEKNNIDRKLSTQLFDEMSNFASYAFNKSHAAAYAKIIYQTAYLKCHYISEYMSSVLSTLGVGSNRIPLYIEECKKYKIEILNPDINKSRYEYTVEDKKIRVGLMALKNIGEGICKKIIEEREKNGEYKDIFDFINRNENSKLSRTLIENMAYTGCFDSFGFNRNQMLRASVDYFEKNKFTSVNNAQVSLFDFSVDNDFSMDKYLSVQDFSFDLKKQKEEEIMGFSIIRRKLYIQIEKYDEVLWQKLNKIIKSHKGSDDLIIYISESKKILKSNIGGKIKVNEEIKTKFSNLLGKENVIEK